MLKSGDRSVEVARRSDLPGGGAADDVQALEGALQFRFQHVEIESEGAEKHNKPDIRLCDCFAEFAHRRRRIARRRETAPYNAARSHALLPFRLIGVTEADSQRMRASMLAQDGFERNQSGTSLEAGKNPGPAEAPISLIGWKCDPHRRLNALRPRRPKSQR